MQLSQIFQQQLQTSAENFLWAVEQIPQERLYLAPRTNRWSIARIVFHLTRYEQRLALPSMLQWLGGPQPVVGTQEEDNAKDEQDWNDGKDYEIQVLIANFKEVRSQQLALLSQLTEQSWQEEREAIWGSVPLKWVVTKTYQHTLEHTDETLRAYLWWR